MSGGGVVGGRGAAAALSRIPQLMTLVLSDASMHVLEDQTAYRDVLLAGSLLGGVSPGSVILGTESFPTVPPSVSGVSGVGGVSGVSRVSAPVGLTESTAPCSTTTTTFGRTQNGDVEDYIYISQNSSSKPPVICAGKICSAGGATAPATAPAAVTSAPVGVSASSTTSAPVPTPVVVAPPPVQLALYMVFTDSLPIGVLNKVAAELQPIIAVGGGWVRKWVGGWVGGWVARLEGKAFDELIRHVSWDLIGIRCAIPITKRSRNHPVASYEDVDVGVDVVLARARFKTRAERAVLSSVCRMGCVPRQCGLTSQWRACPRTR
jgi:hypothetical protein